MQITLSKAEAEGAYSMIQPKGVAMLINNNWETKPVKEKTSIRPTTETKKSLAKMLKDLCIQFGYYVIQREELTSIAIREHMIGLSDQYHDYQGNHNSLFFVASTKSNARGQIIDNNGSLLSVNDIIQHFVDSRCPALTGKPKVFLLFLKVTSKDSSFSSLTDSQKELFKWKNLATADQDSDVYFDPEKPSIDDDFLLVRVMYEEESSFTESPTFGSISHSSDENVPWFAESFIRFLAEQAGTADLLTVINNIEKEFRAYMINARAGKTTTASVKTWSSMPRKRATEPGHVNVFVDHKLKKELYLVPGL